MRSSEWPKQPEPHDGSIYVIVGNKSTLVTPTDEFPLGEVPDDHVICKEMTGCYRSEGRHKGRMGKTEVTCWAALAWFSRFALWAASNAAKQSPHISPFGDLPSIPI
jgi:hypothetical protein